MFKDLLFGEIHQLKNNYIIKKPFLMEKFRKQMGFLKIEIEAIRPMMGRSLDVDYVVTIDNDSFAISEEKMLKIIEALYS